MSPERPTLAVHAHGLNWLAVAEFAPAIPRLDLEPVRHPQTLGRTALVKDNLQRTVTRVSDPLDPQGPGLYLKRYKLHKPWDRLRHLVVPPKPQVEWRACRALQAAGVPTCDVLAIAVGRRMGLPYEGFLISREVQGAVPLAEFLRENLRAGMHAVPGSMRGLVGELAGLTARLVDGGFWHSDYHAGNLLIVPRAPLGRRVFIVDLHSMRLRRPGRAALLRMLATLSLSTGGAGMSAADQEEFLRAFLDVWRGGPGLSGRSRALWAGRVERTCARLHSVHMSSRTRRCLLESTEFTHRNAGGFVIHHRRDLPAELALRAAAQHEAAMGGAAGEARLLRAGSRTGVTFCPCEAGANDVADGTVPGLVCVKSFKRLTLAERAKDILRPRSRARAAWVACMGFNVRGIPAPQPLALLESRHWLRGQPDYVITAAIDNDGGLQQVASRTLPADSRRRLARAVARLLVRMAEEEAYHPDTKPSNLLAKPVGQDWRIWLVDLDRAQFDMRWTRRTWVKSLARLNAGLPGQATLLDRMRCLRECGRGRWDPDTRLKLAREVYRLSLRRHPAWLRQARLGRR